MYGQAHAGLGWVIGVLPPTSDRRLRLWCVITAVLPDIDAVTFLFGMETYGKWHHTFGHNVWLGILCVILAVLHHGGRPVRQRILAGVLVALCFASHILTDMKLSGWDVYIFWPFSHRGYAFQPMWSLGHPLNEWLVYGFMAAAAVIPFWKPVTPLDLVSTRLDRLFLRFFHKKPLKCDACGAPSNTPCDTCGKPVCMKHGRISWKFRLHCPSCRPGKVTYP